MAIRTRPMIGDTVITSVPFEFGAEANNALPLSGVVTGIRKFGGDQLLVLNHSREVRSSNCLITEFVRKSPKAVR